MWPEDREGTTRGMGAMARTQKELTGQLPHHGGRKGVPKGARPPEHTHAWINAAELRAQPRSRRLDADLQDEGWGGGWGGQKGCWDPHLRGLPAGAGPLSVAGEGKDLGREVQTVRRSTGGAHRIAPLDFSHCPPRGTGCLSQGVMTTQEGDPGAPESVPWTGQGLCVCPQEHVSTSGQQACPEKDSQPTARAPMVHTEHKPGSLMPRHASSVSCPTCCSLDQGANRRREGRFCFVAQDSGFTRRKIRLSMPRDVSTGEAIPSSRGHTPPCTDYHCRLPVGTGCHAHELVHVFHTHRVPELLFLGAFWKMQGVQVFWKRHMFGNSGRHNVREFWKRHCVEEFGKTHNVWEFWKRHGIREFWKTRGVQVFWKRHMFGNSGRGTCSGILEGTMFRNSGRG